MTIQEWFENPQNALGLSQELKSPHIAQALKLIDGMSMAKSLDGNALLQVTNTNTLFGYDVGRASVLNDLKTLSQPAKETATPKTNYAN